MTTFTDVQELRFDSQVAIVTGAGRGLGAAYAKLLAARGAAVVVHDAGVALNGSGFDPTVADSIVQEITAQGGTATPCHENLEDAETCTHLDPYAIHPLRRLHHLLPT